MKNLLSKMRVIGGVLALVGALAFLGSGYGYQWGWWGLGTAFRILLLWGGIIALIGFLGSMTGLIFSPSHSSRTHLVLAIVGILLGGSTVTALSYWANEAGKYPPIHDITTDTESPPAFKAIVPLRRDAPNMTEYGGEKIAKIQKEHYPEIKTLYMGITYPDAFNRALQAAESTSWEIVDASEQEGRIEATHTLPWYGFKDDIVIRVDSVGTDSSKIDVRSVSRIGRGDIGVNAQRIRDYLARIKK